MRSAPLTEIVPAPEGGRVFTQSLRAGMADCAPSGRIRLDALARWLQEVAYADIEDAGVVDRAVWVIRRARIHVRRFPRFNERFQLATFCSGLGRMWAERRTTISPEGDGHGRVEAATLWVHLDPVSQRPTPLTETEIAIYGGGVAAHRRVSARLRHPAPPAPDQAAAWHFRATECDLAGHINNTAYWLPLEEELLAEPDPPGIDVEIEYRTPAQPGDKLFVRDGPRRWITDGEGEAYASMLIADRGDGS